MSQQPPRRRSCPSTVTVVAGIAMLGTSAAFALRTSSPGIAWPRSPLTAHGSRSRHGSSSLSLSGLSAQHVASVPRVTDAAVIPSTGCAPSGRLHVQVICVRDCRREAHTWAYVGMLIRTNLFSCTSEVILSDNYYWILLTCSTTTTCCDFNFVSRTCTTKSYYCSFTTAGFCFCFFWHRELNVYIIHIDLPILL